MMRYLEKETRPWGKFFVIEENENYKIKRIEVEPGHRLSYQYHTRRSETWIIIMGKCKITIDDLKNNNQKPMLANICRVYSDKFPTGKLAQNMNEMIK